MRYLLDTPVLSELVRPRPDAQVAGWVRRIEPAALYLSVITFGELAKGIEKLSDGARRRQLLAWVERDLKDWFTGRVLPVDLEVAERWGLILARAEAIGRALPAVDALLAASALTHGMVLVTRNTRRFRVPGLEVFDPWAET
ncbi:type II toxin-antitoxin system VapC family toxin [Oceanithermus sp.]|uniref:type II toxin-antitoxin system VapC family toxin n=1 Tax=Oceanithermus sp. TaxID=2268145 RepID=UPI0025F75CEB|nr:type II toxin-antitoxin system VapC family toxin [Oceanithermus sp.]